MQDFSQLFNNEAQSEYYKSRPEYSPEIVQEMIKFWQSFNKDCKIEKSLSIVDVGCGTGQLTRELIPYACSIIGTDSSESQIKEAQTISIGQEFPKYMVRSCYDIPADDGSLDMVTAAQCVHWFDLDKFYAEVKRCLKPGGLFVISMYEKGHFVVNGVDDRNSKLNRFVADDLWFDDRYFGSLMNDNLLWASKCLMGIPFLFCDTGVRKKDLHIEMTITLARYKEYIMSTSLYQRWKKDHPTERDIADVTMEKILDELSNPESALNTVSVVKYPLNLIMCSKPFQ